MSDKPNKTMTGAGAPTPTGVSKPVPMKFFATWEVDRTPPNCIPRLCSLTLSRLEVFKPLGSDLASISIAVKMQSSKRTLRSNEIVLPANGLLDTGLEMTFSLQYPHFLKRDGNRLHILLQRRKRYKNRTMLGYKTLAEGIIRMDQVLQKQMDMELDLVADGGGGGTGIGGKGDKAGETTQMQTMAKLTVLQLSSTPVDGEPLKGNKSGSGGGEFSDDEDEPEFSSGEEAELSDSEPLRGKLPHARHNLKQRFVSLLRRFRVPDTEASRAALGATLGNTSDIQALFHELESLSCDDESGGEQDTVSVSSTPKPSLRPFFSSSRSLLEGGAHPPSLLVERENVPQAHVDERNSGSDGGAITDQEAAQQSDTQQQIAGSPPREAAPPERKSRLFRGTSAVTVNAKKKHSVCSEASEAPRKSFSEQLARLLPAEDVIDGAGALVLLSEVHSPLLGGRLVQAGFRVLVPNSSSEVRAVLAAALQRLHKHCNSSAKPPSPVRIVLAGGDFLVSACLRHYVELLAARPNDWQAYLRFFVLPLGSNCLSRHSEAGDAEAPPDELVLRLQRHLAAVALSPVQLPVAEAMLTCHDESSQLFIPFVAEVRVGPADGAQPASSLSVEMDDGGPAGPLLSSSPPAPPLTPPSSPNVQGRELPWEPLELQLDYWQQPKAGVGDKTTRDKCSLKGVFRSLHVVRSPTNHLTLTMNYTTKEKKQKIMRLGKKKDKDREADGRSQTVEAVSRLICSVKPSHSSSIRVLIDGTEYHSVKFFQLSSAWQTQVKNFTVSVLSASTDVI